MWANVDSRFIHAFLLSVERGNRLMENYFYNKLCSFFNRPVLLQEQYFEMIKNNLSAILHAKSSKTNALFLSDERSGVETYTKVKGSLAVVNVSGVVIENLPSYSWMESFFCGCNVLLHDIAALHENKQVEKIIFMFDTPGGEVDGVANVSEMIYKLGKKKETIAIVNSLAASAGYWMASACSDIALISKTASVGSIGVAVSHVDVSRLLEKEGISFHYVTAGKYKRITASEIPFSKEALAYLQTQVDQIYDVFTSSISKYQKKPLEEVLKFSDGRVFIGQDAIDRGLASGFADISKLLGVSEMNGFKESIFRLEDEKFKKNKKDEEEPEAEEEEEEEEQEKEAGCGDDRYDTEEDEEDTEAEEEEAEEEEEPEKKKKVSVTGRNRHYVKHGVSCERTRVMKILNVNHVDLETKIEAIRIGESAEKMALEFLSSPSPKKNKKGKRKKRSVSISEGFGIRVARDIPRKKTEEEDDEDLKYAKEASEKVRARM